MKKLYFRKRQKYYFDLVRTEHLGTSESSENGFINMKNRLLDYYKLFYSIVPQMLVW